MMKNDPIAAVWPNLKTEELIGSGASGEVYRVRRQSFGREYDFAVKVIQIPREPSEVEELRQDGMDEPSIRGYYRSVVEQMAGEIDLMESLKTAPNVVRIEDFYIQEQEDTLGWTTYIRMELLENLNHYRDRCGMDTQAVVRLGVDICSALEYCEKKQVIHRDIKPANIFVTEFGDFKLGDFGISRQVWLSSVRSQKGTSAYMAPEVARGESYDKTIDLYSLGIVLYRLLNDNRLPFLPPAPQPMRYEDHQRAIRQRLSGAAMPPPAHGGAELAHIVCRACAYRPEERYPSAGALKAALLAWQRDQVAQPAEENPIPEQPSVPVQELSQESALPQLDELPSEPDELAQEDSLSAQPVQELPQEDSTQPEPPQMPGHGEDVRLVGEKTVGLFETTVLPEAESASEQPSALVQELSQESVPPEPEELPQEDSAQPEPPQVLRHGDYVGLVGEETIGLFETTVLPKTEPAPEPPPDPEPEPILEEEPEPEPEPPEPAAAPEKERLWPRWRTLGAIWALCLLERLFIPMVQYPYLHIVFLLIAVLLVDGLEAEGGWQAIVARWKDRSRTKRRLAAFVLLLLLTFLGFC